VFSNFTEVRGSATVDGTGSLWENQSVELEVGSSLTITNGGSVRTITDGFIGGIATVSGANSLWELPGSGFLMLGNGNLTIFGNGGLTISNGGKVKSLEVEISGLQNPGAHVTVSGGSVWEYSGLKDPF